MASAVNTLARLDKMPSQEIIDGLKGVVDFYYWKGIPCARKWPHWAKREPTPDEKAAQDRFAYAARSWKNLPEYVKAAYNNMAASTFNTGREIYMRTYLSGLNP